MTKTCPDCHQTQPVNAFHKNRSASDGLSGVCRTCASARHREHYAKNKEAILARNRRWREANRDADLAAKRKNYQKQKEEVSRRGRINRLRSRYGLTVSDYEQMVHDQDGRCAICMQSSKALLHVDHDHKSGAVRGLLCGPCNKGIGHLNDDISNVLRAAAYLVTHTTDPLDQVVITTMRDLLSLTTGTRP